MYALVLTVLINVKLSIPMEKHGKVNVGITSAVQGRLRTCQPHHEVFVIESRLQPYAADVGAVIVEFLNAMHRDSTSIPTSPHRAKFLQITMFARGHALEMIELYRLTSLDLCICQP